MDILHYSVTPAYGRNYRTEEEAKAAWLTGKDFQIQSVDRWNGSYISIRDAESMGLSVTIRYNNLRDIYVWPEPAVDEMNTG